VVAGRGEEMAAAAGRDRGHFRASRADRERAIEVLKTAFVEDRLTRDEFDLRVGQALASRTYADLAALTADIPAEPAVAEPAVAEPAVAEPAVARSAVAEPAGAPGNPARTLARAARRSGICMLVPLALVGIIALTNAAGLIGPAFICGVAAVIAASGFMGYGVVDAWQQRRSGGQLPPRPGQRGQVPEVQQPGHDPALPRDRPNQACADLTSDPSRPGRPHPSGRHARTPRGLRPVPGTL
jgi:Domain of unknown function (DUF1707)